MKNSTIAAFLFLATLTGCSTMLPSGSTDTPSTFASFDAAREAAEKIVPFKTRTSELAALGFDPLGGRNVTLIPYPEIAGRLAPYPGLPLKDLDPGVRKCIEAQASCKGFVFHFERQDRRREGNFWGDFFNIRRVTTVTGWWFDALVVESNGVVLFRSVGGQPRTDRVEKRINPLGPLQPAGESAGSVMLR